MSDRLTRTLLVLTFVTGIVDAVSFLALGQVFAAMQTGNVIFLGFGISGAAGAAFAAPLVGLVAFVAGGGAAVLLMRPGEQRTFGLGTAIAVEAALLGSAALLAAVADVAPGKTSSYSLIALLSLTMGARNTTIRRIGDPNLATTVLNLTVIAFATGPPLGVAPGDDLAKRAAALLALLAGAVSGALLLKTGLVLPIAVAVAITLAAGLGQITSRSGRPPMSA